MPLRPTVHLFIGLHKTGSTAIRFMLDLHRELLDLHGLYVPRTTWTSYVHGFWNGGHNNIPWEICGNHPPIADYGSVSDLADEIAARPDRQHVLLSEDLDVARPEHIERLRSAFEGFDVRIVLFIRSQPSWLQAIFAEEQKWFGAQPFDDWYRAHRQRDDRLDLHSLAGRWADVFGSITIRCYEEIRHRVFDAFLECCNAPLELRRTLAERGVPIVNATPGEYALALIHEASTFAQATGIEPGFFNRSVSGAAMSSARQIGRFDRTRSVLTAAVMADLRPMMQETNRQLSERFAIPLASTYLDPSTPEDEPANDLQPVAQTDVARVVMNIACDLSFKAAVRMRMLAVKHQDAAGAPLIEDLQQLIRDAYPWRDFTREPRRLDGLLQRALSVPGAALYLERRNERGMAYRHVAAELEPLCGLARDEWDNVMAELQYRAGFAPVLGFNLRQGFVDFANEGGTSYLRARHALTADGELATIGRPEPRAARRETARAA